MSEEGRGKEGNKVVCLTGASGYRASWIVTLLLHHHFTVHATVRDPSIFLVIIFFSLFSNQFIVQLFNTKMTYVYILSVNKISS